jgi:hypothetical protein
LTRWSACFEAEPRFGVIFGIASIELEKAIILLIQGVSDGVLEPTCSAAMVMKNDIIYRLHQEVEISLSCMRHDNRELYKKDPHA